MLQDMNIVVTDCNPNSKQGEVSCLGPQQLPEQRLGRSFQDSQCTMCEREEPQNTGAMSHEGGQPEEALPSGNETTIE